jgi:signal transduction histidine kinase
MRTSPSKLTKLTKALASRILELTDSNRELQLGLARHDAVNRSLVINGKKGCLLLEESLNVEKQLQQITRQILTVKEDGRKKMSLHLQDEIVQTLEGIHLRLLVLNKEVSAGREDFKKEIANTQDLVLKSVGVINKFANECGLQYEN